MFLTDVSKLSRGSHAKVSIECSEKVSDKCKGIVTSEYRDLMNTIERNNGVYMCLFCSRQKKYLGEDNPNASYSYDRFFFNKIDTKEKAYILGWIASDGSVCKNNWTVAISILEKDLECLEKIRDILSPDLPIRKYTRTTEKEDDSILTQNFIELKINSKQVCEDICHHLRINRGKKSYCVSFPDIDCEELTWHFIRGYFDGDGHIRNINNKHNLDCSITSYSPSMLKSISDFTKIPNIITGNTIIYSGTNCLDFMGKLYNNCGDLYLKRKYERYVEWLSWRPALLKKDCKLKLPECFVSKTSIDAIIPSKTNDSDAGYDLTIIKEVKKLTNNTVLYDTGIKLKVLPGLYAEIVPRSSISKSGYILANSIGVIDASYRGNLFIALTKIDENMPDLVLPFRCCQLIFREQINVKLEEVVNFDEDFEETTRGSGGFGSTGN